MLLSLFKKALWISGLGLLLLGYSLLIEPAQLKVRQFEFRSDKYQGPDIRIALVTDIHIGGLHVPSSRVLKIVNRVNMQNPDIVLLPGDFVSGHENADLRSDAFNSNIAMGLSHLERLSAPAFSTIGNHDAWWDAARVARHLEAAGVRVLDNKAIISDGVCLVGLADFWTGQPERAAYNDCPTDLPLLVFTHSPDAWESFRSDSILAFAGHTHGGQVNLPFIGRRVNASSLGPEHSYGFSKISGVDLFVSAGVGTSILPIRFRAPPEIVILTLRSKD